MLANMNMWLHFSPALMMLVIFGLNLGLNHKRADRRSGEERQRLQAALVAELRCLADLYRVNLQLIGNSSSYLFSARSSLAVYRANLGKLMLLDENAITDLVCLHARNENIEIQLSALSLSSKSTAAHVYRFERNDAQLDEIKQLYADGLINIQHTCSSLGAESVTNPANTGFRARDFSRNAESHGALPSQAPSAAA